MTATPATPTPQHRLSDLFIDKWINENEMLATPVEPAAKILTSDVYEWTPGRFSFCTRPMDASATP